MHHPHPANTTENDAEESRLLAAQEQRDNQRLESQEEACLTAHDRQERQRLRMRDAAAIRRLWAKREAMARRAS